MEAQTRCHCGSRRERPPKGTKQSPDVRRKGVGGKPHCSKIVRRYADRDGERNIFDVESQNVCRWASLGRVETSRRIAGAILATSGRGPNRCLCLV
jgi:hypothetical protein